jgi:hypothetical protein
MPVDRGLVESDEAEIRRFTVGCHDDVCIVLLAGRQGDGRGTVIVFEDLWLDNVNNMS